MALVVVVFMGLLIAVKALNWLLRPTSEPVNRAPGKDVRPETSATAEGTGRVHQRPLPDDSFSSSIDTHSVPYRHSLTSGPTR